MFKKLEESIHVAALAVGLSVAAPACVQNNCDLVPEQSNAPQLDTAPEVQSHCNSTHGQVTCITKDRTGSEDDAFDKHTYNCSSGLEAKLNSEIFTNDENYCVAGNADMSCDY